MDQPTVLIISNDVEFPRAVTQRWQAEGTIPAFTLMGADLCQELDGDSFDLAIVAPLAQPALERVLCPFAAISNSFIFIVSDADSMQMVNKVQPRAMVLRQNEGWLDTLLLVGSEALRCGQAVARAQRAEQANAMLEREAALGHYILEMRHTLNNALTSVLGNSELLLLDPGSLSAEVRLQIETIRNMAVRVHEILKRLTSLEKEMSAVEKLSRKEYASKPRAVGASL